jgi:cytochrome c-type biogenesis protein CcmH/NrfF
MVVIRRGWPAALALVAVVIAVAGVLMSHRPAPPLSNRVEAVAKTLRCPTCQGESVAASDTPIARSMRAEIRHQLRAGRSPDEVRHWFADRYGAGIVTTPSTRGPELLLWVLPIGVLAAGGLVVVARSRRRTPRESAAADTGPRGSTHQSGGPTRASRLSGRRVAVAAGVCATVGLAVPAAVALPTLGGSDTPAAADGGPGSSSQLKPADWTRLGRRLDRQGDPKGAEDAYRRALADGPSRQTAAAARTRLAFDLLRDRRFHAAERLARPVAQPSSDHHAGQRAGHRAGHRALALLVLGLAQRGSGERAEATVTLHEFLRVAPHHPAAPQVRRLLRRH